MEVHSSQNPRTQEDYAWFAHPDAALWNMGCRIDGISKKHIFGSIILQGWLTISREALQSQIGLVALSRNYWMARSYQSPPREKARCRTIARVLLAQSQPV